MQKPVVLRDFVKLTLAIAEIAWYNTLMNKNENKAIDEATARAEAGLIITEAIERGGKHFLYFLRGWMEADSYAEMARAAESWIESDNYTLPEKEN
jgi:hypothetical protein